MTEETTTNHGYETPRSGRTNWHEPLNENFENLDRDVIVKGPHGDRPDDPETGTWYLSTDRKWLSRYDGGEWAVVGGVGTDADPVPGETNVEAAEAGELRVNGPDDVLSEVSPLAVRHHSGHGPVFAAQNHDDEGSNSDRKCKFWFYNDDGTSRLAEFAPSEVKPVDDADETGEEGERVEKRAEWSNYIRAHRLSDDSQLCEKWLNVIQSREATTLPDPEDGGEDSAAEDRERYFPVVQFKSNKKFEVVAAETEPTRLDFHPGGPETSQHVIWNDVDHDEVVAIRHRQDGDEWALFDYDAAADAMTYRLGERAFDWNGTTHEDVVWESGSDRPKDPEEGQRFFDAELGQPIWYDGDGWVDANGESP